MFAIPVIASDTHKHTYVQQTTTTGAPGIPQRTNKRIHLYKKSYPPLPLHMLATRINTK